MISPQYDKDKKRAGRALSSELLEVARQAGFEAETAQPTAGADTAGAGCASEDCGCEGEQEAPESAPQAFVRSALAGGDNPIKLPKRLPIMKERRAQSNIPDERADRDRLRSAAAKRVADQGLVPPISLRQLREHSAEVCRMAELDEVYRDFAAVLINNECWREELAQVPFERRLLLIPKCLRVEEHCPAPFDQFGMLCKECGLCSIEDLTREAEELGYAVLIAEGSAIVTAMVETGKVEAIVGVSCLNVLEKCFPHMEAVAIPGMSIPLLQDDCIDTNVDLDQVRDLINLSALDRTYRLDLEGMKSEVRGWFTPESIEDLMGPMDTATDRTARAWLARSGKRWRPFLAACMWLAVKSEGQAEAPPLPRDLKKLALAVECFHKASLVHDDIEDESTERRGGEAMHIKHGIPLAINAGDTLTLLSLAPLMDNIQVLGMQRSLAVLREVERVGCESAEGQALELGWRAENVCSVTSDDYLLMVLKKTCWLTTIYPIRVGALIGAGTFIDLDRFMRFGFFLGSAFQIQDDILNLEHTDAYGKERDGDLWEGKRTLIIIRLYALSEPEDRRRIERILGTSREDKDANDILWLNERISELGCIEHARRFAMGVAGAARAEFDAAFAGLPQTRDLEFIRALTYWVFERES